MLCLADALAFPVVGREQGLLLQLWARTLLQWLLLFRGTGPRALRLPWAVACGFSSCGCSSSVVTVHALSYPVACGISQTRHQVCVPCTGRILNYWTSRKSYAFILFHLLSLLSMHVSTFRNLCSSPVVEFIVMELFAVSPSLLLVQCL